MTEPTQPTQPTEQHHESRPVFLPERRAGRSGLVLPPLSLGLWQNFGRNKPSETQRAIILAAIDLGIWHIDNANRYGPPHGWAEEVLGEVLRRDLRAHRSSLVIATKAGNPIAPGPYGRGGSRKHLIEALDASLERLGLDHVDVFYSHSPDPSVPFEETAAALEQIVRSGKALYIGISNYSAAQTVEAVALLRSVGVPLVLHQHKYSLLERGAEDALHAALTADAVGGIVYSPLAQGLLTDRYLGGSVPADSRAAWSSFLDGSAITEEYLTVARSLDAIARDRGVTLAQLALQWVLRDEVVTSAIIGASSVEQLRSNVGALDASPLDAEALARIEAAVAAVAAPLAAVPPVE